MSLFTGHYVWQPWPSFETVLLVIWRWRCLVWGKISNGTSAAAVPPVWDYSMSWMIAFFPLRLLPLKFISLNLLTLLMGTFWRRYGNIYLCMDTANKKHTHNITGHNNVTEFVYLMVNISFQYLATMPQCLGSCIRLARQFYSYLLKRVYLLIESARILRGIFSVSGSEKRFN